MIGSVEIDKSSFMICDLKCTSFVNHSLILHSLGKETCGSLGAKRIKTSKLDYTVDSVLISKYNTAVTSSR